MGQYDESFGVWEYKDKNEKPYWSFSYGGVRFKVFHNHRWVEGGRFPKYNVTHAPEEKKTPAPATPVDDDLPF
jgi:hypothetical protein